MGFNSILPMPTDRCHWSVRRNEGPRSHCRRKTQDTRCEKGEDSIPQPSGCTGKPSIGRHMHDTSCEWSHDAKSRNPYATGKQLSVYFTLYLSSTNLYWYLCPLANINCGCTLFIFQYWWGLLFLTSITTSFQIWKWEALFVPLQQFTDTSVQQMICISKSAFLDSGVVLCQALW